MKHVLITGGAGFIGSHLTERFLREGFAVSVVDNFVTGQRANIAQFEKQPDFHFTEADVSLPLEESRLPLIARHGLHGVLHFACPASPVDFEKIPFEILQVDSLGTFETVGLALRHRARYVLASTSEIYGDPLVHPQTEEYWGNVSTLGPRACYDETKRFAEAIVSTAIRGVGTWRGKRYESLNGAMVRIFNTYGPRMRPDDGRVVPELCMQALRGEPLTIHGDGQQTRSFCYVEDLVEGIFRLYQSDQRVPVNIGNPVERTILNFAEVIQSLSNKKSPIRFLPGRADDPKRRCPDISKAKASLGWEPRWDLEAGLKKTLEFFRSGL